MKTASSRIVTAEGTMTAQEVYRAFVDNQLEGVEQKRDLLSNQLIQERDVAKVPALQKELRRLSIRMDILINFQYGHQPCEVKEVVTNVADPEIINDLAPLFEVITDLCDALGMTWNDTTGKEA